MAYEDAHHKLLPALLRAVSLACAVCRRAQGEVRALDADDRSTAKDDDSPVTVADWASQAVLVRSLTAELGPARLVAEENADVLRRPDHRPHRARVLDLVRGVMPGATEDDVLGALDARPEAAEARGGLYWAIDPIDGTKGFLRGEQYCVSVALVRDGAPFLGALGCPNLSADFGRPFDDPDDRGVIYFARKGDGLFEVPADAPDAKPVQQRRLRRDADAALRVCESVESRHTSHSDSARVLELMRGPQPEVVRLDSQCKYAVVGRGQADLYLRLPSRRGYVERVWDHAAGALIAAEGGCAVTDVAGRPLDFSRPPGLDRNKGIICADPDAHGRVLDAVERLGLAGPPRA